MRLHFLGTTGYHPNRRRDTACLMLPSEGILLDAGTGIFRARELIETDTLDIFLSHVHLDHCVGLTFLLDVLHGRSMRQVRVHADRSKHSAILQHLFSEELFPVPPEFELVELGTAPLSLRNGGILRAFPVEHPGGCLGFRLDWPGRNGGTGHSMAYVTDTTASRDAAYVGHLKGVGLLVHECYFPDGMEERALLTGHSCLTPVAEVARESGAVQTWLVHLNPLMERDGDLDLAGAHRIFPHLRLAEDGMIADF